MKGKSVYSIGLIIGSLSSTSINRIYAAALQKVAPADLSFTEIPIRDLPLYSEDYDADFPQSARDFKQAVESSDGLLVVSPEYNRSVPGGLKNALDWGSRPKGSNSFQHMPTAITGTTRGVIGTAVGQHVIRHTMNFLNVRLMTQPEAYMQFKPGLFEDDGTINDESTQAFLTTWMSEFRDHVDRVRTVLPRQ